MINSTICAASHGKFIAWSDNWLAAVPYVSDSIFVDSVEGLDCRLMALVGKKCPYTPLYLKIYLFWFRSELNSVGSIRTK